VPLETTLVIFSIGAAIALGLGTFFVLNVRRALGRLPTGLIAGENLVWLVWNIAIFVAILTSPSSESTTELLAIVLLFVMPASAGFCNCVWQYLLYKSFRTRKSHA